MRIGSFVGSAALFYLAAALGPPAEAGERLRDSLLSVPAATYRVDGYGRPGGDYQPPADPQALQREFWATIYRLERQQADYGYRGGRQQLATRIGADLDAIPEADRPRVMSEFLTVAYQYHAMMDPEASPDSRAAHEQTFLEDVRSFRDAARQAGADGNRGYLNFYADIRALAFSGPDGLRISRELAKLDPGNEPAQRNLAQDLVNNGQYDDAVQSAKRASELDPSDPQPYTTMASAKYSLRDYPGAQEAAAQALRRDPDDSVAYSILKLAGDRVEAPAKKPVSPFETAPPEPAAQVSAASAGPMFPALSSASSEEESARRLADLSALEFRKGDFQRSAELATRSLEKSPGGAAALHRRALALLKLDRPADALADVESALRGAAAREPGLLMLKARVLNRLRRHGEALEAADAALGTAPENDAMKAELYFQKAWALAGMGRREEAARSLAAAARLDARFGPYYDKFLTLPADADANLFFSSELEPAPQSEEGAFRLSGKARTMAIIVGSSLSGGFLVALGLISLSAPARERIKTLVRTSPGRRDAAPDAAPPADGPVSLAATRLQEEGSEVGAFLLRRQIGAGGMGVVYEAFDRNLERRVAIKKLREDASGDPRAAERVLHEARTVAALRHPNIVEIYSVVAEGADIQLVFEFVDGHTLQELMRGRRRLPYDWSLGVMEAVAGALDYAHGRGVIHRDLKPSNVMIDKEGSVKVMDFGIAQADRTSGRRMTGSGTPLYMAPEHERGEARRESDVYSMGVTLYEMVTGRLPFSGTPSGISLSKLNASYVPPSQVNPDLPSNFDRVLAFALAPDPAKRWRTPSEFVRNLQALGPAPSRTPRPG